jgi:DNA primase
LLVADFILEELNRDKILMNTEEHELIRTEYEAKYKEQDFDAEKYFLYHPNQKISLITAELISEKYTLSKIHSKMKKIETDAERLYELVPRIIYEFKNCIILDIIRDKLLNLKIASEQKNDSLVIELMQELNNLKAIEKKLAKTLGERVLTRFN